MRRYFSWFLIFILCFAGCAEFFSGTSDVAVPDAPTSESSEIHTWQTKPVLIQLQQKVCNDACLGQSFSTVPNLILYADGRLIVDQYDRSRRDYQLKEGYLSQTEMCALFNTIDQVGFFDYDITEYHQQNEQFPRLKSSNYIEINAWKSLSVDLKGFEDFLDEGILEGKIEVSPVLLQTFAILTKYKDQKLPSYTPERIILKIESLEADTPPMFGGHEHGDWPLEKISLNELFLRGVQTNKPGTVELILSGSDAMELFHLFGESSLPSPRIYEETHQRYDVSFRVLFPYETTGGQVGKLAQIPSSNASEPSSAIFTCTQDDGLIELP